MGKENFTLIRRACIFRQALRKADVFLDILLIYGLWLEFIQQRLFCPILDSNKLYCQCCKRKMFSFALRLSLGLFYFDLGQHFNWLSRTKLSNFTVLQR